MYAFQTVLQNRGRSPAGATSLPHNPSLLACKESGLGPPETRCRPHNPVAQPGISGYMWGRKTAGQAKHL
jgi:hypothetical protein